MAFDAAGGLKAPKDGPVLRLAVECLKGMFLQFGPTGMRGTGIVHPIRGLSAVISIGGACKITTVISIDFGKSQRVRTGFQKGVFKKGFSGRLLHSCKKFITPTHLYTLNDLSLIERLADSIGLYLRYRA
jgi:hypothetical protein